MEAVRAILETLKPVGAGEAGKALVYVWALEQKDSRRGWDEGHDQDVMVPWVMKTKKEKQQKKKPSDGDADSADLATNHGAEANGDRTFHRYYHLYKKGELEGDIEKAGGTVLEAGYEKDNWWAIAQRKG